jgi:hypothetical protein
MSRPGNGPGSGKQTVSVSRAELIERLKEQVRFLESSTRAFDEGMIAEAKRLAVTIRVLVHDTAASKSLLGQLGIKQSLRFTESLQPDPPGNMAAYHGVVGTKVSHSGAEFFAWLDDGPPFPPLSSTFQEWWSRYVIRDHDGSRFTRKDLVLTLANKEGGAHVDPELEREYVRLSRENSLRYYFSVDGEERNWPNDPVPHTVRHVAHELLKVLHTQVPEIHASSPHGWGWRLNGLP